MKTANEEIFDRVNESKLQASFGKITPQEWAQRKVDYYKEELVRKEERQIPLEESEQLLEWWKEVVAYFKNK